MRRGPVNRSAGQRYQPAASGEAEPGYSQATLHDTSPSDRSGSHVATIAAQ